MMIIARFGEPQFLTFVELLWDTDVQSRLQNTSSSKRYKDLTTQFLPRTVNAKLKNALRAVEKANNRILPKISKVTRFQELVESIAL